MDFREEMELREAAEAARNLCGDGDLSPEGFIEIDRADPQHPVIRLRADRLGGGSVVAVTGAGCYQIVEELDENDEPTGKKLLANQYYVKGGVPFSTNFDEYLDSHYGMILALRIPAAPSGTATLEHYADFAALVTASKNPNYVTRALYQLDNNGEIVCDFRNMPTAQVVEVL